MMCTLLNENGLCRDMGDVRGVNPRIRLSQWCLPPQLAAVLGTPCTFRPTLCVSLEVPGRWKGLPYRWLP